MLSRRQFLSRFASTIATGAAAESLSPFTNPALYAEAQDAEVHLRKRYTQPNRSYGSGSFGDWSEDSQGLPCYRYTCNQLDDAAAVTPVETAWRDPTDQTHQIGNDRIVAAVSNYGYVQVRQDEGGPKLLNDYRPEDNLFGAGIGYLTDGNEILATYYPGTGKSFDRFFGMGYLRKQTAGVNYSIDQTIFAPFGDDPVLISEVVISSQSPTTANLHWFEYWGCQSYPLSWEAFVAGSATGNASVGRGSPVDPVEVNDLRRASASGFGHRFERLAGDAKSAAIGLIQFSQLLPQKQQRLTTAIQEEDAADLGTGLAMGVVADDEPSTATPAAPANSSALPPTFLASLDDGPLRMLTNAAAFFGPDRFDHKAKREKATGPDTMAVPDRVLRPAGLAGTVPGLGVPQPIAPDDLTATGRESALILDKPLILEAGQSTTLRFIYGYVPEGFSAADLIAKYRGEATGLLAKTAAAWKDEGVRLTVESEPWIARETHWHSYYLRSGFTYDDVFKEHILSQGAVYQYCMGYQGEARDPLQHALPLIFSESNLAKQVLRYALKSQAGDGALPFAIIGHGQPMQPAPQPSDFDLWLLWLASEYILGTRDTTFLEEQVPSSPPTPHSPTLPVKEFLARSYHHLIETIGTGKHGLLRGLSADWNAQLYYRGLHDNLRDEIHEQSESLMNAAMAACILDRYAAMLRYSGDAGAAKDPASRANQQREAVRNQWAGNWFKRVWLGQTTGWLGEDRMWLDGQPWAILGQCATEDQRRTLVKSVDELLRKPSRIGAKQVSRSSSGKPVDWPGVVPGETTNGGIYDTLTGPLIWALAGIDGAMAYDEWKKNSRANHADVYRDIWYGIWSGPDVFCSSDSDHAGQTGYDWGLADLDAQRRPSSYRGLSWTAWPVMNMHRHAWPLYSASKLMGIEFTEAGVDLAPIIPKPTYSFRSKLVGVEKMAQGYQGWYAPQKEGSWMIRLKLPASEIFQELIIDDSSGKSTQPLSRTDGIIQFQGNSTADHPLKWALTKA